MSHYTRNTDITFYLGRFELWWGELKLAGPQPNVPKGGFMDREISSPSFSLRVLLAGREVQETKSDRCLSD